MSVLSDSEGPPVSYDADAARVYELLWSTPMPLMRGPRVPAALDWLAAQNSATLFPGASAPELALAGLWLAAGGWERAHEIAQNVTTPDGAYWHGILHRQEPDAWNAKYWFRQVPTHPVFAELSRSRAALQLSLRGAWDPFRFVDLCVSAEGTPDETKVRALQHQEWRLLVSHCARSDAR